LPDPRVVASVTGLTLGLAGLVLAALAYTRLNPTVDPLVLLTPLTLALVPLAYNLSRRATVLPRIDITPLATAPLAYAVYYITAVYLKTPGDMVTLVYSITLGASTTLLAVSIATLPRIIQTKLKTHH